MPNAAAEPIAYDYADLDDVRKAIIVTLRERCPTGFMSMEQSDKIAKLTPLRRKKILALATAFPMALNLSDIDGRTPLAWLARYDEPKLLSAFLALGAHPRGAQAHRHSIHPVAQACELRHGDALALLATRAGIEDIVIPSLDPHRDRENKCAGSRALYMAAYNNNGRGIQTLLALGADPMAATANGDTPMHALAYGRKNAERAAPSIRLLAQACPELILAKNHNGLAPAALAAQHGSGLAPLFLALEEEAKLRVDTAAPSAHDPKPRL